MRGHAARQSKVAVRDGWKAQAAPCADAPVNARSQLFLSSTTACAASASLRPIASIPSLVVALTLT